MEHFAPRLHKEPCYCLLQIYPSELWTRVKGFSLTSEGVVGAFIGHTHHLGNLNLCLQWKKHTEHKSCDVPSFQACQTRCRNPFKMFVRELTWEIICWVAQQVGMCWQLSDGFHRTTIQYFVLDSTPAKACPDSRIAFCVHFSFLTLVHKEILSAPDKRLNDADGAATFCSRSGYSQLMEVAKSRRAKSSKMIGPLNHKTIFLDWPGNLFGLCKKNKNTRVQTKKTSLELGAKSLLCLIRRAEGEGGERRCRVYWACSQGPRIELCWPWRCHIDRKTVRSRVRLWAREGDGGVQLRPTENWNLQ